VIFARPVQLYILSASAADEQRRRRRHRRQQRHVVVSALASLALQLRPLPGGPRGANK
jgi:hypothetical protein